MLGASTPARAATNIGCGYRAELVVTAKPRDCFLDWPNLPLAEAVHLRRVVWTSWGGPVATGRALVRTKVYDPWTHVRVRAFTRRACATTRLYTRVRVDFGRTSSTWRMPGCADVQADD
jgi:hypothetical protein